MSAMPVEPAATMGASTRVRGEVTSMNATAELTSHWPKLLRIWQELDIPRGWRSEITEWGIVVTPSPHPFHYSIADLVHKAFVRALPDEWAILQGLGVEIPPLSRLYQPDFAVITRADLHAIRDPEDPQRPYPAKPEKVMLVAEITSPSNANYDRQSKLAGYAAAGIPIYLLIDRCHPKGKRCTVYSEPRDGDYQRSVTSPFGEPVHLPAPFDLDLDTSKFE